MTHPASCAVAKWLDFSGHHDHTGLLRRLFVELRAPAHFPFFFPDVAAWEGADGADMRGLRGAVSASPGGTASALLRS